MKERSIREAIQKVCVWRQLYVGRMQEDGSLVRYSLKNAAKKLKMSKKSLDDYLHQIRLGRKYKFDFKKLKDERFGVLRTFNRKLRIKEKASSQEV